MTPAAKTPSRTPAKATRPNARIEEGHQRALFDFLRLWESRPGYGALAFVYSVPNGFYATSAEKGRMVATGLRAGVWDVAVPCPRSGCPGMFIELKTDAGRLSHDQERFRAFAESEGFRCVVTRSWVAAAWAIVEYMGWAGEDIARSLPPLREGASE